jgi:hypothetical protein
LGNQDLIAIICQNLSKALTKQDKSLQEALSFSERAVKIFLQLRHPNLEDAQQTQSQIQKICLHGCGE